MTNHDFGPGKLDRSLWEGCRFCGDGEVVDFLLGKKESYCRYCGRPLTEDAWSKLEMKIPSVPLQFDYRDSQIMWDKIQELVEKVNELDRRIEGNDGTTDLS